MRYPLFTSLVFSSSAALATEWPIFPDADQIPPLTDHGTTKCVIQNVQLLGNYSSIQNHPYQQNCVIRTDSNRLAPQLVPIGKSSLDGVSRITLNGDNSILLRLGGASDNALAGGKRGRQEVSNCFLLDQEFNTLPMEEQAFRFLASDVPRNCSQASGRYVGYSYDLRLDDTPTTPASTWDAIVMQLHALDDKDRYCMPYKSTDRDTCNQHNGVLGKSARNPAAYTALVNNGAVFEGNNQPPLSFRVKEGYFSIVATSNLKDPTGRITPFSAKQPCNVRVNDAAIEQVHQCADTGKTITVLYREKLEKVLTPNRYTRFRVQVKWPTEADPTSTVRVETLDTDNKVINVLVDDSTTAIGAINDQFPYFKAGIYRQNSNAIATTVRLANLRKVHHFQDPEIAFIRYWEYNPLRSVVGDVYEYANPYNGDTEYFELKALNADGRYGYFPTDKTSNQNWTYLGKARNWGENDRKAPIGSIFVYANQYTGLTEYFRLKALGGDNRYWYFPTDQSDNHFWTYMGTR